MFPKTLQTAERLPLTWRKRQFHSFLWSGSSVSLAAALWDPKCPRWWCSLRPGHLDYLEKIARIFPWGMDDIDSDCVTDLISTMTDSWSHGSLSDFSSHAALKLPHQKSLWKQHVFIVPLGPATPVQNPSKPNYHLKVLAGPAPLNSAILYTLCHLFQLQPPIPTYTMS